MLNILKEIKDISTVGITGHVRPDGDCLGACSALYNYIKDNCSNVKVKVHLEMIPEAFEYLAGVDDFDIDYKDEEPYDVFFCLDSGSLDRIGNAEKYFKNAKKTISIDHHISNGGYSSVNHIVADASSTCEVLFNLFDYDKISYNTAVALYTGIIHDTGVFKHSNTSEITMVVAGKLIAKKVPFTKIIEESFYQKTFKQNKILAYALEKSFFMLDNKCIVSAISQDTMNKFDANSADLDGIIDQLRITKGVEIAILLHEIDKDKYKVSLRANGENNVNKIATSFGGGGHIKASGCMIEGKLDFVIQQLTEKIKEQI